VPHLRLHIIAPASQGFNWQQPRAELAPRIPRYCTRLIQGRVGPTDKLSGICKHNSYFALVRPSEVQGSQWDCGAEGPEGQTPANYLSINKAGLQAATEEQKLF